LAFYRRFSAAPGKERIMTRAVTPILLAFVPLLACGFAAPASAQSKTCHSEIIRLQGLLDQSGAVIPDMKESDFATTHHQPTPDSIAAAKEVARAKAAKALDQARQDEAQGKEADCLKVLDVIAIPGDR
jgi:hypothetical protein